MGNVFALLGMRALFVLVEGLIARFRYLDETIAIVLGLVGVKLLIEDVVKIGPLVSLVVIAVAFAVGIALSIRADRRDPDADRKREERVEQMKQGAEAAAGARATVTRRRTRSPPSRPRRLPAGELTLSAASRSSHCAPDLGHPGHRLGHRGRGGVVEHLAAGSGAPRD